MSDSFSDYTSLEKWLSNVPDNVRPSVTVYIHGASSADIAVMRKTIDGPTDESHEGSRWVEGSVSGFKVYVFRGRDDDE